MGKPPPQEDRGVGGYIYDGFGNPKGSVEEMNRDTNEVEQGKRKPGIVTRTFGKFRRMFR